MSLYAIGDFHLSFTVNKPMDVFDKRWKNHVVKIEKYWKRKVTENDTVVITGDHSWGRDLAECQADLDFIMALPNGYDTVIGEGGASLSGGEKQRISIARAIMKDAPIIILDEATANVDPESEQELTAAIEALTKEKTILMIAHRLKTVRHADNILVIDKGRIAQSGTHEQLMEQGGIYRRFVESREQAVGWKV